MLIRRSKVLSHAQLLNKQWVSGGKLLKAEERDHNLQTVIFLHGLLGSGKNLRSFVKRFTEKHTHISALLLDARGHGASYSPDEIKQNNKPITLKTCALDLIKTVESLDLTNDKSPMGVVGHSFGARLALEYTNILCLGQENNIIEPPTQTWMLDAIPGKPQADVRDVIYALSDVKSITSKKDLIRDLTSSKKYLVSPQIASWMTTNLIPSKRKEGSFTFSFDLDLAHDVLNDMDNQDFFERYENIYKYEEGKKRRNLQINIVRGGKNKSWSPEILDKFDSFLGKHNSNNYCFMQMHLLKNAGHWVHIDDLDGLLDAMDECFRP